MITLYDENDVSVGTFSSIQAAVDAALDGYRLVVDAGTYVEVVSIDVDITIEGPNAGVPGTGARAPEAVIQGGVYVNAPGVTLDGLTVLNGAMVAGNPAGIFVNADGATITNMVLTGQNTNNMAAVLTTYNGNITGLTLSDSLIQGWDWGTYFNPTTGFTATGNSFDNNGNGILGDDWASGTLIDNNSFTNSTGSHVGYGVLDSAEDVGDYFGTGNTFDADSRATSIFAYGDGTPGGQTITGTDQSNGIFANEFIAGSGTDSTFNGEGGDDYLYGGLSNDNLNGGADTDTAAYDNGRSEYTILATSNGAGMVTAFTGVTDNNGGNGNEGTDSFTSIERLDFDGAVLSLGDPVQLFDSGNNLIGTFTTIQSAINASANGQTIRVAAGTYNEVLTLNKDVTIEGPNVGVAGTDPRAAEAIVNGGIYITSAGAGATLDGLRLDNGANSVGGVPAGIHVSADNVTLTNMVFDGAGTPFMPAVTTPYNGGITGLVLSDSLITGWSWGTYFNPTTQFTATGNSFDGNGNAILGDDWDDVTLIDNNSFTNSTGSHVGYGVLDTTDDVGAFFGTGNTFGGASRPTSIFAYGDGTPASQTVYGTELSNLMRSESASENVTFFGRGGDDRLDGNSGTDTLHGGTGNDDLRGAGGSDAAAYDGVRADYTVNGPTNGFGMYTGFTGVTDNNGGNGNEGTDTFMSIERVQFSDVTFDIGHPVQVFDSGGNLVGTYATIQGAVDGSANGQTIRVAAGTYNETVTVNKDVTIEGPNTGVAGTGARSAEAIVNGGFYITAAGATLDGLTVLNGAMPGGNPAGIFVNADDVTITNMVLTGQNTNNMAAVLTTYNGNITGLELSDSLVQGWDWGTYFNPTTGFTATGNSFDNNGNAILGDDWAAGTFIDGNSFTNSTGSHIGYGSFDSVEDMRSYVGQAGDLGEIGNTFDAGSRAVSVFAYGDGSPGGQTITGTDDANGFFASEQVPGSGTNSTFNGLGGNDYFYGGSSNDSLNGGTGTDTASYDNNRGDYSIAFITGAGGRIVGFSQVGDNVPGNGNEGVDALSSIEVLEFADRTFDTTMPVQLFDFANQLVGTFTTIQAAIDAAQDDYTIRVAAGIFDEELTIDVGVRILGAKANIAGTGGSRDAAGGVGETTIIGHTHVTASENVQLNGLRFLNDATTTNGGPSNPTLQIQTGGGAGGHLVTNSIFWSTVAGGARPSPDDRAISTPVIADGSLTITNNLISGSSQGLFGTASWGRGIWFDGGGINLTVTGNTIEWSRTGLNLDMSGTSVAFVDNNLLQNLGTGVAVGFEDDNAIITNNDVHNVGEEFNFRNLTVPVVFDVEDAIDALTTVGNANDLIVALGGSGNDTLSGSSFGDLLDGNQLTPANPDSDTLDGRGGNDILLGRAGDDNLIGAAGDDQLDGGDGTDSLNGGADADTLAGGGGNDSLTGGTGNDSIDGGSGADTAHVGTGATFVANGANWTVTSSDGADTMVNVELVIDGGGDRTLLVGSGGYATIQAAINAAQDGDTILIAAGVYAENVTVNVANLTITADPGAVLRGTFLSDNSVSGPLNVWLKTALAYNAGAGAGLTVAADGVTINGLTIEAFNQAIVLGHGTDGLTLNGLTLQHNFTGIHKAGTSTVTGFEMVGGAINDGHLGMDIVRSPGPDGAFDDVTIDGVSFADLNRKGIYVEALSDALLTGITMTNVGEWGGIVPTGAPGAGGNGINLNLKYDDYSNVTIEDFTMTDVGSSNRDGADAIGHQNGGAIVIEARDDAPSYSGDPATLTGVVVRDGTIDGTSTGVHVGEPAKQNAGPDVTVENVVVTGAEHNARHGEIGNEAGGTMTVEGTDDGDTYIASGNSDGKIVIDGGDGADTLTTGSAADTLTGGGDNDTLDGAGGIDTAIVGTGATFTANGSNWTVTSSEGTDTLTNIEIVDSGLGGNTLLVGSGGFATIQAAVDAASDGDTILVAAGVYTENVNFHKAVTVLGAHAGDAGSTRDGAVAAGETTLIGRHDITATGGAVTLDGLRFLNNSSTSNGGPSDPILQIVTGGGHVVTNSVFYSEVAGGARPSPDDRAISMPPILAGEITISDNYFTGASTGAFATASWGRAIWFDGGGVDLDVTGNTFEYSRTGINMDLSGDSEATVSGNLFTTTGTAMAVGIDMVGLSVTDNDFNNAGEEFNFRNQTLAVVFDAEVAVDTQVGPFIDVLGGSGNDTLSGTSFADLLDGNQLLPANADNDILDGRGGNDMLLGRAGDDTLTGGADNDLIDGGTGLDTALFTGSLAFADSFLGWIVTSGEGTDILQNTEIAVAGSGQRNLLVGATGFAGIQAALDSAQDDDHLRLASTTWTGTFNYSDDGLVVFGMNGTINATFLTAGSFGITVQGGGNNDNITTGTGNDVLNGGGGSDRMRGGAGADTASGQEGDDIVYGESGDDVLNGDAGGDFLDGGDNADTLFGGAGNDVLIGGLGADFLDGGADNDIFASGAGDDRILGGGGDDSASGGLDADVMYGGTGQDTLYGEEGADYLDGEEDDDFIDGGAGADILLGGAGLDRLIGAGEGDRIVAGADNDIVYGDGGDDIISGEGGADYIDGGDDADTIDGGAGNDVMLGGLGADFLDGGADNDIFVSGAGDDRILGGSGDDSASGGLDADVMYGGAGEDTLYGEEGADYLDGEDDDDFIDGGAGADILLGGAGLDRLIGAGEGDRIAAGADDDIVYGDAGDDILTGDGGADYLDGGDDADTIDGGLGADILLGGAGGDDFAFTTALGGGNVDVVVGFEVGLDQLLLDDAVFAALSPGALSPDAFVVGTAAQDSDDRIVYDAATGALSYDADGVGGAAAVQFATLNGAPLISASDFQVI